MRFQNLCLDLCLELLAWDLIFNLIQPEAIVAISSSEESSTKSENEIKRKSKKSKKSKNKRKEHEKLTERDEDDIPLDQMIQVQIDDEANEALETTGFQVLKNWFLGVFCIYPTIAVFIFLYGGEKSSLFYFKSGVFTYDVHKKTAEKFAKAPKICIWCEKEKSQKLLAISVIIKL